jgi:hypothetical protein
VCLQLLFIDLLIFCAVPMLMYGCVEQSPLRPWASAASAAMCVGCAATGEYWSWEPFCASEVVIRLGSESGGRRELFGEDACSMLSRGLGAVVGDLWATAGWLCTPRSCARIELRGGERFRVLCLTRNAFSGARLAVVAM